ncbi:MAG: PEGA domain-containing protein [Deltaproteobacteria bacterium]|nr:PEGA domain-containing protein [Deltaproteobacteria bacterium]
MSFPRRVLASCLVLALAWPAVLPAPAVADAPTPPPAVAVTAFLLPHAGVPEGQAEQLMLSLERGLKKNSRLAVKDSSKLLADYAGEIPSELISTARKLLAEGTQAMLELDTPNAVKKLGQAVEALEQVLPFIQKNELAEAMMSLAVAHLAAGDRKQGKAALQRLLTWRETLAYDTEKYPPKYLEAFEEAKKEVKRRPRGSIEVRSEPEGAQAYVNGKFVGVTPATAEGLVVGDHYVTLKKEGFQKLLLRVHVSPKKQESVQGELKRSEKYKLVQDALERAKGGVEKEVADPGMVDLKAFLFVDQVVFVRLSSAAGRIHVDAFLFDLRSKRRLSVVRRDLEPQLLDAAGPGIADNLYLHVPYDGALVAPPDEKPPEHRKRRPFYFTWWFWTAIGVTTLSIIIPVSVTAQSESRAPDPFRRVVVTTY